MDLQHIILAWQSLGVGIGYFFGKGRLKQISYAALCGMAVVTCINNLQIDYAHYWTWHIVGWLCMIQLCFALKPLLYPDGRWNRRERKALRQLFPQNRWWNKLMEN